MKRINLTHGQVYKLYAYCKENADMLTSKTITQCLAITNKELDFPVSTRVVTIALKELNIFTKKAKRGPKGVNKALECQIKTLAIAVKELYEDMGSKVHPGVQDIVTLYTKE